MTHPKEEQTLVLLKPDALQRNLLGEIIHRFEVRGLKIIGMKMIHLNDALLDEHYAHIKDKPFFPGNKAFMSSYPVVAIVISAVKAVAVVRTMLGPTKAYEAAPGTIRGDYSLSTQANIAHASDSLATAKEEIKRFFAKDELYSYKKLESDLIYSDDEKN
jgi:nucleoside-diphosphate kinase